MNPLLERNKSIYRLLLIIASGLALLQVLLVAFVMHEELAFRLFLIVILLSANAFIFFLMHKELSSTKVIQLFKKPLIKIPALSKGGNPNELPEDLDGWKYLKAGISDILNALGFMVLAIWVIYYAVMPEYWVWIALGLCGVGELWLNIWYRKKLYS